MFDIAFSELAVIGAVALVVLGPERLPKVARTAGHLFGRLQRYVSTVKADIAREMETAELTRIKDEIQGAAQQFEQTVRQESQAIASAAQALQADLEKTSAALPPPATPASISASAPAVAQTPERAEVPSPSVAVKAVPVESGMDSGALDFGIEPWPRSRT